MQIIPSYTYINVQNIRVKMNLLMMKICAVQCRITCKSWQKFLAIVRNTGTGSSSVPASSIVPLRPYSKPQKTI